MYLQRSAENRLRDILTGRMIGLILGARQVGKTTLVRQVLAGRSVEFLNFDLAVDQTRFRAVSALAPLDAWKGLGAPEVLVIDEVQRWPDVSRVVKGWFDSHVPVQVLLLGSSSLQWLDQTAESLTGPNRKLVLPPLLFQEALGSQSWVQAARVPDWHQAFAAQIRAFLGQRLAFGSYPEVVLESHPVELLRDLSSDYLWKDILQAGLVKSPDAIKRLLLLLAHQIGSEVSVNELSTQLGMTRATIDRYLDLLEQTFVLFRIPAFSTNRRREIVKSQKYYFWDTGIRNALLNSFSTDETRPDIGPLWENWVIAEVKKANALAGNPAELFFWRSKAQSEVDLVLRQGGQLKAFEVKWSARRAVGRAFRDAYGASVELLTPDQPFVADLVRDEGVRA